MKTVKREYDTGSVSTRVSWGKAQKSSKSDQFFSRCWVDGDGVIEINLASPHLDSDSEALDDLIGALADYVDTHNSLFGTLHDELEGCGLLVILLNHAEVEGLERSFVNLHRVPVLFAGFWLSQADGSHGRVREDDRGDVFVVEFVVLEFRRTEETVGKPSASSDGDGGQEPFAGDVSNRSDTGNVGVLVVVNDDIALGGGLDTKGLQTEGFGVGLTANCPQENVGFDLVALVSVDGQIACLTLNLGDLCLFCEV